MLENMFFVLKLHFPGKNNGRIKGDKCLVGQKRINSSAPKVLRFGEIQATRGAWLPGLGQRTGLTACGELCSLPLGFLGGPGVKHARSSAPDSVSLCSCPTVALPEGTAGVALGVRGSENALACPQDSRCPSAALSRADTSMQPTAQT